MAIFSAVLEPTKRIVKDLLADPNFGESLTYKLRTGEDFDTDKKYVVGVHRDIPLVAARMRHTKESVRVSSSPVEVGDLLFLFLGETFPVGYSTSDQIVDAAGVTYGIKGIDPIFSVAVIVTVSGVQ